jgi:aminoglycoside phosphotransferase (APT) family kinase protein
VNSSTPAAEVSIDSALVRSLLQSQHPDLSGLPVEEFAAGWDNATFRLGCELAVRLPRRSVAVVLLEQEQKWLPTIARQLPIPTPSPLRVGRPGAGYPWCWSIVPWIRGETADRSPLKPDQAGPLARFLRALHVGAPPNAPKSEVRGVPLRKRAASIEDRMRRLEQKTPFVSASIENAWQAGLQAEEDQEPTWIHGDLHSRNVLVDNGMISGVIDWGDMTAGDRATDLAAIWMLLPNLESRVRAMEEYENGSRATWLRARAWAVLFGVLLLDTGLVDNPRNARMGELTLRRIAAGPA